MLFSREQAHQYWRNPSEKNLPKTYILIASDNRTRYLVQLVRKYTDVSASILEIGCNVGRNLNGLFQSGYTKLMGVEINADAIALMQKTYPEMAKETKIWITPIEEVIKDFKDDSFDLVFTMAVLQHIHNDSDFIFAEIARITRKFLILIEGEESIFGPNKIQHDAFFGRSYQPIFEQLRMKQVFQERLGEQKPLSVRYRARIFGKRKKRKLMLKLPDKIIPYGHQWLDEEDIQSVVRVFRGDWITQGSKIKEFEEVIARFVGTKYAVALSSGTAALHAACFAVNIGLHDQVITSPITFAATANCILYTGGTPAFADIKDSTCNIDPAEIKKKINRSTKAIIPVDFAGQPADLHQIRKIAEEYNLIVIEDACHALGAEYRKQKVGSFSDLTVFSFHPVKHITTGEGGMVTTNQQKFYEKLLMFRTHGITKNRIKLMNDQGPWFYEMQELGYNYRITDFQCALGISQLKKLNEFIKRRREIVRKYDEAFKNLEELIIPYEKSEVKSAWHIYVIRLKLDKLKATRKEIFEILRAENIGVQVHYIPVYYHPYYQKLGYHKGLCPKAESYYEETITLPLFPKMSNKDVENVIDAVEKIIIYYRK